MNIPKAENVLQISSGIYHEIGTHNFYHIKIYKHRKKFPNPFQNARESLILTTWQDEEEKRTVCQILLQDMDMKILKKTLSNQSN